MDRLGICGPFRFQETVADDMDPREYDHWNRNRFEFPRVRPESHCAQQDLSTIN